MKISDLVTDRLAKSNPLTKAIVRHYDGHELVLEETYDDDPRMYQTPEDVPTLMICGDDSWGAVTGVIGINGHLVVVACFGDDGPISFSPTLNRGKYTNPLSKEKDWVNVLDPADIVVAQPLVP